MKKKVLSNVALGIALMAGLTACGGDPVTSSETIKSEESVSSEVVESSSEEISELTSEPISEVSSEDISEILSEESSVLPDSSSEEISSEIESSEDETTKINEYINLALNKLDKIVKAFIDKIPDEDLKAAVQNYYEQETEFIRAITDLKTAKESETKVVEDTKAFIVNTLKPLAITKLNGVVNPLISDIKYEELEISAQAFYDTEIDKLSSVESLEDLIKIYNEIIEDTKAFIKEESEKVLTSLKNKALEELDPYVTTLISKIPYEELADDVQSFYAEEKKKLEAVNTFDGVEPCVNEIKADLEEFALSETKKIAVSKLEEVVNAGLAKIPNKDLKDDLTDFSEDEIAKLNAVIKLEDVPTTLETVISETTAHIKELCATTVKDYFSRLTAIETATAYDYLPEAMQPNYTANLVNASDIAYDFTKDTSISSINHAGYGEQWQMVVENINQSLTMAKVFNVAQTALNAAGQAANIAIQNTYADEMNFGDDTEDYGWTFQYKDSMLYFNVTIKKDTEIPAIGTVKPVIKMAYDLSKETKAMFISLGDAYKIKYLISDNAYEMACIYGVTIAGKSGSRSSLLQVTKDGDKTNGHIYEFSTYEDKDVIKACADFYVDNGYVSVVGNKASGIVGMDNYINELYLANEGRLLGYEIRETKTIIGVEGTYNTLWFNIWDISGINSIKVTDKTENNESERSTCDAYINNSSSIFTPTYNKLLVKTSRKYDIELRKRYYYTYDDSNEKYVSNEVSIPMLFIQEEDYSTFISDVKDENSLDLSVSLNTTYLNKILSDYDTLIDVFIQNKELITSETIQTYLSEQE